MALGAGHDDASSGLVLVAAVMGDPSLANDQATEAPLPSLFWPDVAVSVVVEPTPGIVRNLRSCDG